MNESEGREQLVRTANQLRWWALGLIAVGVLLAAIGEGFGVALTVAGATAFLVMQYLGGRYG